MRMLVACSDCNRQFDATGCEPGSQFRCHCGSTVTVQQHLGYEASVIRCSSCGAPCEDGAAGCRFCGADFTLHERDLHTVCPKCFARVSDRARFCHHCGGMLAPEQAPGNETSLVCPACGENRHLRSRMVADVAVLECPACAGLWLGNAAFSQLANRALGRAENVAPVLSPPWPVANREPTQEGPWRYRNCPECGTLMNRRNYGPGSGVIIDVCRQHGLWLDAEELPAILNWIRRGGQVQSQQDRAGEEARSERYRRALTAKPIGGGLDQEPSPLDGPIFDFARFLIELAQWLWRYR